MQLVVMKKEQKLYLSSMIGFTIESKTSASNKCRNMAFPQGDIITWKRSAGSDCTVQQHIWIEEVKKLKGYVIELYIAVQLTTQENRDH